MLKQFTANHPVRFTLIIVVVTALALIILGRYLSHELAYARLTTAAQTLPAYDSMQLASGKRAERECYVTSDGRDCKVLIISVAKSNDTTTAMEQFIATTKKQGVEWVTSKPGAQQFASKAFTRSNKQYHLEISQYSDSHTTVALYAH